MNMSVSAEYVVISTFLLFLFSRLKFQRVEPMLVCVVSCLKDFMELHFRPQIKSVYYCFHFCAKCVEGNSLKVKYFLPKKGTAWRRHGGKDSQQNCDSGFRF